MIEGYAADVVISALGRSLQLMRGGEGGTWRGPSCRSSQTGSSGSPRCVKVYFSKPPATVPPYVPV